MVLLNLVDTASQRSPSSMEVPLNKAMVSLSSMDSTALLLLQSLMAHIQAASNPMASLSSKATDSHSKVMVSLNKDTDSNQEATVSLIRTRQLPAARFVTNRDVRQVLQEVPVLAVESSK